MFFSKKMPEIQENWTVGTSEHNGMPMIIRKNEGISVIAGKGYFNLRSGISYKYHDQTENGLPTPEENLHMNVMDDKINEYYDNKTNSVVAIVITTSGFKEYVIYHNNSMGFSKALDALQQLFTNYQLTTYTENDKKWELYKNFQ